MSSKRRRPARAAVLGALLAGGVVGVPGTPIPSAAAQAAGQAAHAVVVDQAGVAIGHVELADEGGRTRVHVEVSGLTPGFHGFHVHAGTACTGDFVASAMGHHNPEAGGHGSHDGDMPVLFADAEGRARTSFVTDHFTVDAVLGRAVIVHAGRDNLANIPDRYHSDTPDAPAAGPDQATLDTGDSGARVGCGTIAAGNGPATGGYRIVASDGRVQAFGSAADVEGVQGPAHPVVGAVSTPSGAGQWLAASDGGVFTSGDAGFAGSMGGKRIAAPVVGIAAPAGDAHVRVVDQAGVAIGHVELADEGGRTRVHVEVSGLTPGFHGFHVHAGTACTGDFVASAMGHHNPEAGGHGSHDGDMPVLFADAEGRARTSFVTDHFTVDAVLGRAVIVHAGRDNLANIPDRYHSDTPDAPAAGPDQATLDTGDSGARVGCGTIAAAGGTTEDGYWLAGADGGVFAFGDAGFHGSMGGKRIAAPVVGMAPTPGGGGYWLVGSDGGVFAFGDAGFHGSMGGKRIAAPVVGMAPTPTGRGYWLVGSDGGVFAFGDAGFHGSMGGRRIAAPVVGMAPTPTGRGYWLVASDGGVFAFGDARFAGSTGARRLAAPVVDLAATPTGAGYWLLGADGGIFAFGDADFRGSGAGTTRGAEATDIVASHR